MNIWIVNQYAITPRQSGITRHYYLAQELIKMGHNVTIIASSFDHVKRRDEKLIKGQSHKIEHLDGITFLWLRTPAYEGNSPRRLFNMFVFARRVWFDKVLQHDKLSKPDIIMGSTPHLFGAFAAKKRARRLKVPFVLEVRDLWPQSLIDLGNISPRHPLIQLMFYLEKHLYKNSKHIISLLPGLVDYLKKFKGKNTDISWIPNGVTMDSYIYSRIEPSQRKEFVVMYAGTHGLANGLDMVLDAAKLLPETSKVKIQLVGDGPLKQHLQERVSMENIPFVEFRDSVPKTEIPKLLTQAHAFLMILKDSPVFRWGISPNKLFDYMATARPVIFAVNTPFNIVESANAGLTVSPVSPQELAKAMQKLSTASYRELSLMGENGREFIQKNHVYDKLARDLLDVMESINN